MLQLFPISPFLRALIHTQNTETERWIPGRQAKIQNTNFIYSQKSNQFNISYV